MKPELEKIERRSSTSFIAKIVKRENRPMLSKAWHYHPEIEICYTLKSKGRRYVGNNISDYKEMDLVILGSNLPHGFTTPDRCEQYVIQFNEDFLGQGFFKSAEFKTVKSLLDRSKQGCVLNGMELEEADYRIKKIFEENQSDLSRLIHLIEFLDFLARSKNLKLICSENYTTHLNASKLNSIKAIFDFVENNYQKDIGIKDACKVVNLTESAFYKFIKRHTNKKFTTILNEYRIDHAYKLLASSSTPISQVAYISGYNNFSHFNRVFKQTYKMTPRQFRKQNQFGKD